MNTQTQTTNGTSKPKPAEQIQVAGVRIPIWANHGEDGTFYRAGEPELSYKGADGQWRKSTSYSVRDLVNLITAAVLARSAILKRTWQDRTANGATQVRAAMEELSEADHPELAEEFAA